jgi:hypothetical protein
MTNDFPNNFAQQPFEPGVQYEFRVNGRIGQEMHTWFEGMTITVDDTITPPQTFIRGVVRDQSAFYGLISRCRDLGLALISVNQVKE